jgi:hypothetical protein
MLKTDCSRAYLPVFEKALQQNALAIRELDWLRNSVRPVFGPLQSTIRVFEYPAGNHFQRVAD